LDWPQAGNISKVELKPGARKMQFSNRFEKPLVVGTIETNALPSLRLCQ